jgi:flagellar basal-body rod modification protein FlgD
MSPVANVPAANTGTSAGVAPARTSSGADPLTNESTFLTLLVSQLQNQDPLSPVDSNQFVSQLTAYSQLEQLIGIHNNTTALASATNASAAAIANSGGN